MAGSGHLAEEMARAFRLPFSEVNTALKSCRAARLIQISGRGTSAAEMSEDDAVALITAIASFSVTAEVPGRVKTLLEMPCRHVVFAGGGRLQQLLSRHHFHGLIDRPFKEGAARLFREEWQISLTTSAEEDLHELGDDGIELFNPLAAPDALKVVMAFDGTRSVAFATIESQVKPGMTIKLYYSSADLRAELGVDAAPGHSELEGLGLKLYSDPPPFLFSATICGQALVEIAAVLAEPVKRTRNRKPR